MKIGLINIEPKVFNTAYMQISQYHKLRGDVIEWWTPLTDGRFDRVYCSSLFDFTDKSEVPERAVCGGTGYDITGRLPVEIENCKLDYSIYPKCDRSIVWFSRGCKRNCPWCVVPQKEGDIETVEPKNLNPAGEYIVVQDNDFFGNPQWEKAFFQLRDWNKPVDMQGVDVRSLTIYRIEKLIELRHHKRIKIAWDNPKDYKAVLDGISLLTKFVRPYRIMCYVLIGFDTNEAEDLGRIRMLRERGIDPFVMPFDKSDIYQRTLARWVNHKAIYKKVPWDEYKKRVNKHESAGTGWSN